MPKRQRRFFDTSIINRSKITNGSRLLPGVDGRSSAGRRYRDLCKAFEADLGGKDSLSTAELALVRLAAATTVRAEAMQAEILNGEKVSDEQIVRLLNASTRVLKELRGTRKRKLAAPRVSYADRLMQQIQKEQTPNG